MMLIRGAHKKTKRKTRSPSDIRESLKRLPPPDGKKIQGLLEQGKKVRRRIEKQFESVRSVTAKDMQQLLG